MGRLAEDDLMHTSASGSIGSPMSTASLSAAPTRQGYRFGFAAGKCTELQQTVDSYCKTRESGVSGSAAAKIRVALHVPDNLTHSGLASCINQDRRLSQTGTADADVVVLAQETTSASTMDALRSLSYGTAKRFLLIVEGDWRPYISTAVQHGVRAILWRPSFSASSFLHTIHEVGNSEVVLSPSLQGMLIDDFLRVQNKVLAPRNLTTHGLASREVDVLRLISEGFDLKEIAQKLAYSERTIKNIIYQVMKRQGLRNRAHAVSFAIRSGLI
ncbi:response regulator transcription factor [Saccharopolyspora pogona]|uniref:response regulator transcription factor n=1 Tax=Saccharopolyspora pogona TaxID=333966 RepID=UPI001CC26F2F|nr:response regulator transcription factor [Saccharopolyspora pogona]